MPVAEIVRQAIGGGDANGGNSGRDGRRGEGDAQALSLADALPEDDTGAE